MGRPSVDPELMIRMLFACYCMGVRSERRLCEEVHLNLAYRWFCGLGLDGRVRDHSTFSKNRHGRFCQSDMLRRLFETVVQRCLAEGLVGADGFAVDASLIAADANKQRSVPSREWKPEEVKENAVRAAREYLAALDNAAFGAASPMTPKFISRSDPAVQAPAKSRGICMKTPATRRNSGIRGGLSPAEESRDAVAHLKRILRRTRLRLRCPKGDNDEFLLAATSQNLRRLARLRPINMLPEMLAA
jgi:transposase